MYETIVHTTYDIYTKLLNRSSSSYIFSLLRQNCQIPILCITHTHKLKWVRAERLQAKRLKNREEKKTEQKKNQMLDIDSDLYGETTIVIALCAYILGNDCFCLFICAPRTYEFSKSE